MTNTSSEYLWTNSRHINYKNHRRSIDLQVRLHNLEMPVIISSLLERPLRSKLAHPGQSIDWRSDKNFSNSMIVYPLSLRKPFNI